jgi:hypothetical protein
VARNVYALVRGKRAAASQGSKPSEDHEEIPF